MRLIGVLALLGALAPVAWAGPVPPTDIGDKLESILSTLSHTSSRPSSSPPSHTISSSTSPLLIIPSPTSSTTPYRFVNTTTTGPRYTSPNTPAPTATVTTQTVSRRFFRPLRSRKHVFLRERAAAGPSEEMVVKSSYGGNENDGQEDIREEEMQDMQDHLRWVAKLFKCWAQMVGMSPHTTSCG